MCQTWYLDKCHSEPEGTPCSCSSGNVAQYRDQFEARHLPVNNTHMAQTQEALLEKARRRQTLDWQHTPLPQILG